LYDGTFGATHEFFETQYRRGHSICKLIKENTDFDISNLFVLEVGCGAGGILKSFKDRGAKIIGIDLGEDYVNFGKDNYGLELKHTSIYDVELEHKPNLIIYSHVLEHILHPNIELKKVYDLLDDGGYLYIEVPGIRNLSKYYNNDFLLYLQNAHTYHFSLVTLNNLLKKNKFEPIYGNDVVNSLFRKNKCSNNYQSDYYDSMTYLKEKEKKRKYRLNIINKYRVYKLKLFIIEILKKMKIYSFVRAIIDNIKPKI